MINKKNTNKVAKIAFVGAIALSVMAQPLSTVAHAAATINPTFNLTTKIASPVVNPVVAGSTVITGTALPGAMMHVNINNKYYSALVGNDGKFSVKVPFLYANTKIEVSQTFDFKTFSLPTTVTVSPVEIQPTTPSVNPEIKAPVVNPVSAGNAPLTGTALPGAMLHINIGGNYYSGVANKDGQFSVQIPFRYAGTKIEVSQTFNFKTFSLSTTIIAK
ncbi:hypothetical protein HCA55_11310 [Listeria booriae]|uniref:Bacterial Ig domain-containing protein n=1 Tax=Listeria booriae TaxID=1552123 RepID=A0A842B668_9LIST|nr:Ig-like domain-containing protein [Listeria booriae]MBC1797315.1 hypothetical protein [Listeria booriae]